MAGAVSVIQGDSRDDVQLRRSHHQRCGDDAEEDHSPGPHHPHPRVAEVEPQLLGRDRGNGRPAGSHQQALAGRPAHTDGSLGCRYQPGDHSGPDPTDDDHPNRGGGQGAEGGEGPTLGGVDDRLLGCDRREEPRDRRQRMAQKCALEAELTDGLGDQYQRHDDRWRDDAGSSEPGDERSCGNRLEGEFGRTERLVERGRAAPAASSSRPRWSAKPIVRIRPAPCPATSQQRPCSERPMRMTRRRRRQGGSEIRSSAGGHGGGR